jgi:hypothetical protein
VVPTDGPGAGRNHCQRTRNAGCGNRADRSRGSFAQGSSLGKSLVPTAPDSTSAPQRIRAAWKTDNAGRRGGVRGRGGWKSFRLVAQRLLHLRKCRGADAPAEPHPDPRGGGRTSRGGVRRKLREWTRGPGLPKIEDPPRCALASGATSSYD